MIGTLPLGILLSFSQISNLSTSVLSFSQLNASHTEQKTKHIFKKDGKDKTSKKCSFTASSFDAYSPEIAFHHDMLVFTSFSVPIATWKEHSYVLQKIKGAFVLRGLPNNSFEELSSHILELRKAGVQAEILLDPESFERFEIQSVPSILLQKKDPHDQVVYEKIVCDKVAGNIPIVSALTLFSEKGDTKESALKLLKDVKQ